MLYQAIGSRLPGRFRKAFENLFYYSGIEQNVDKFLGFLLIFNILISAVISIFLQIIFTFPAALLVGLGILIYVLIILVIYMLLWFSSESKSKTVENFLPDALNLMAVNIKSGMTTDRAFLLSAMPQFGPLEREMKEAGKKIISGIEIRKALLEMTGRIKSEVFNRTIKLIVEGMESGGELARLLEETSQDIQKTKITEKEVKANLMMYVFFIFFAAAIAVPVIYGISTNIVEILTKRYSQIDPSKITVSANFLVLYSVISILVTSIFSSLIIGLIKEGKGKAGVKYIPVVLVLSMILFFLTKIAVSVIFPIVG